MRPLVEGDTNTLWIRHAELAALLFRQRPNAVGPFGCALLNDNPRTIPVFLIVIAIEVRLAEPLAAVAINRCTDRLTKHEEH